MSTSRTEAFSDGVFGFAATLLVLSVAASLASLSHTIDLASQLLLLWPAYATYAVSFLTIGIIWINHHGMFSRIKRVARTMKVIDLLTLIVMPFTSLPRDRSRLHLCSGHQAAQGS